MINDQAYGEAFTYLIETNLINIDELGQAKYLVSLLKHLIEGKDQLEAPSQSWLLTSMGLAYADLGENQKAKDYFEVSKAIYKKLGLDYMVDQVERMMKVLDSE
jgi:hypothetical protein